MSEYKPEAPEWWRKYRRLQEEATRQAEASTEAARQERISKIKAWLKAAGKLLGIILGVAAVTLLALMAVLSSSSGPSRRRC